MNQFQCLSRFSFNYFFFLLLLPSAAFAQLIVDPQGDVGAENVELNTVLSFSEIEYDADGRGGGEVERTILGISAAYGLQPSLDLYGELAYILEAELENGSDDDGFFAWSRAAGSRL